MLDGVGKSISQIFAPEAKSPASKASRTENARSSSPGNAEPFSRPERNWLAGAVNECNRASTLALATAVDTRFQAVEEGVEQLKQTTEKQSETIDVLTKDFEQLKLKESEQSEKFNTRLEDIDMKHSNDINEIRELIEKAESKRSSSSSGPSSAQDPWFQAAYSNGKGKGKLNSGTNINISTPTAKEEWSGVWVLGNLGYDTEPATLLQRGRELLSNLPGFSIADLVKDIRPNGTRQSSCVLVEFNQQNEGENWRDKVFNLKHTYPENQTELRNARKQPGSGKVYLSKQQTETQRRPLKITRRCGKELERIENRLQEGQRKPIVVDEGGKYVIVAGKTVGFSFHGAWQWTDDGLVHLQDRGVHRDAITAAIEQTW